MDYREFDDATLIALMAQGRQEALEELYDRHARRVFSLAMSILSNRGSAEEVTQDAFTQAWRRASTYKPELGKVSSWLLSITHHRAIDTLRRKKREVPADLEYEEALALDLPGFSQAGLEEHAVTMEVASRIRNLLAQLPEAQREVLILAYFYGYTQSEIAKRTKQPLGTVKTRMRSAIIKLRESMGSLED